MFKYAFLLIFGVLLGLFFSNEIISKIKKYLLPISILVLLFFMGVAIGKDTMLKEKIAVFGINAVTISLFSIFFSIVFAYLFVRFSKK